MSDSIYYKMYTHLEFGVSEDEDDLKYISDYTGEIVEINIDNDQEKMIGKVGFKLLLLDLSIFENFNWSILFDHR